MFADLAADSAVRADPETPGRYHITLPDHWDYLAPSGGVVVTCALRAAEAALAEPLLRLASTTTIFCTPIRTGKLIADVQILRRGGATAQLRVAMRHAEPPPERGGTLPAPPVGGAAAPGIERGGTLPAPPVGGAAAPGIDEEENAGLELIVTFIRDRKGADIRCISFPDVLPLADSLVVEDDAHNNPHTRFRFYHQYDCRIADGDRYWLQAYEPGPTRYARWFRYKVPQRDAQGRFDRLALPPLIDTMPTALHRAIGPGGHRFYAPSLDLTTYVVDDTTREWLLVSVRARRARSGWAIADAEVWDDEGKFIAYGSQAMYMQAVSGEPPVIDASKR